MGNSETRCASLFIYWHYHFGSVVLTNTLDTVTHRKGTFVICPSALRHWETISQRCFWELYFDCEKRRPVYSFFSIMLPLMLPIIPLPSPLLSLQSSLSTRWFFIVDLCALTRARVLVKSIIRSREHFDTHWLVNVAESLLGENRTVIWLCKISLPQYQLSMYCNVKAHYSWPICGVWRITVQTSICTFYLDPLSHSFHSWYTAANLFVSAVCFWCDWFCCLKYKIGSGVTHNTWGVYDNNMTFPVETCIPTQGKCWCVNRLLKHLQQLILYSYLTTDRKSGCLMFPLFLFVYFCLKSINKQPVS